MSDSSNYSNTSDIDDIEDIEMVMQLINEDQQVQGESSRRSRKAINRERDIAEARYRTQPRTTARISIISLVSGELLLLIISMGLGVV
ncbi:hypothetical protein Tco_0536759 [Tanacetum coccineum]